VVVGGRVEKRCEEGQQALERAEVCEPPRGEVLDAAGEPAPAPTGLAEVHGERPVRRECTALRSTAARHARRARRTRDAPAAPGAVRPRTSAASPGFEEFLAAIADRRHPEHRTMLTWAGGSYDPADFDAGRVRFDDPAVRLRRAMQ
jgi:hypothetical protein